MKQPEPVFHIGQITPAVWGNSRGCMPVFANVAACNDAYQLVNMPRVFTVKPRRSR
jgi:hypothetical protein